MQLHKNHRKNLQKSIENGLIFLASSQAPIRNHDVHYAYRQDSDFLYLTGIEIEGFYLLIDGKTKTSHLFAPDLNLLYQIWEGKQLTKQEAKKQFGVDQVHYHSEFDSVFQKIKAKHKILHCLPNARSFLKNRKSVTLKKSATTLRKALDDLRVHKSPEEVSLMKLANRISSSAHRAIMQAARPQMTENQLQAVYEKVCLEQGARLQAYLPIFAGGRNAAILHYHGNNQILKNGDLLLVDAGSEWMGYASDITRTFPINGRFSDKQAQIYDVVLQTQKSCLAKAKPGISLAELHRHSQECIAQGLIELGLFKTDDVNMIIASEAIRIFYPHGIGHMLGLDVHDVGGGKPNKKLKLRSTRVLGAGCCITIEPGVYFIQAHFENKATRQKFAKLIDWKKAESYFDVGGVRIEDNIWITKNGNENLTTAPKERSEIEKIMSGNLQNTRPSARSLAVA